MKPLHLAFFFCYLKACKAAVDVQQGNAAPLPTLAADDCTAVATTGSHAVCPRSKGDVILQDPDDSVLDLGRPSGGLAQGKQSPLLDANAHGVSASVPRLDSPKGKSAGGAGFMRNLVSKLASFLVNLAKACLTLLAVGGGIFAWHRLSSNTKPSPNTISGPSNSSTDQTEGSTAQKEHIATSSGATEDAPDLWIPPQVSEGKSQSRVTFPEERHMPQLRAPSQSPPQQHSTRTERLSPVRTTPATHADVDVPSQQQQQQQENEGLQRTDQQPTARQSKQPDRTYVLGPDQEYSDHFREQLPAAAREHLDRSFSVGQPQSSEEQQQQEIEQPHQQQATASPNRSNTVYSLASPPPLASSDQLRALRANEQAEGEVHRIAETLAPSAAPAVAPVAPLVAPLKPVSEQQQSFEPVESESHQPTSVATEENRTAAVAPKGSDEVFYEPRQAEPAPSSTVHDAAAAPHDEQLPQQHEHDSQQRQHVAHEAVSDDDDASSEWGTESAYGDGSTAALLKQASTKNPAVLEGKRVFVAGHGEGTVLSAVKRIGRATKFEVQFDGDSEPTSLKLKRSKSKAGEEFEIIEEQLSTGTGESPVDVAP